MTRVRFGCCRLKSSPRALLHHQGWLRTCVGDAPRFFGPYLRRVANRGTPRLDQTGASEVLRERLPEFAPTIDEHLAFYEELLFHVLMGELARFYVDEALLDPELQRRFWMAVDWLQEHGDRYVQNALGVSLIEWFAWGDKKERELLVHAKPLMSSAVRAVADDFLRDGP